MSKAMSKKDRDCAAEPYSVDEQRVVDYLAKTAPDIGAGADPIGFLIASHAQLSHDRRSGRGQDEIPVAMKKA